MFDFNVVLLLLLIWFCIFQWQKTNDILNDFPVTFIVA